MKDLLGTTMKEEMVPPPRDVLFNPNLTHNDGLLAQEIIRSTGLTYMKRCLLRN